MDWRKPKAHALTVGSSTLFSSPLVSSELLVAGLKNFILISFFFFFFLSVTVAAGDEGWQQEDWRLLTPTGGGVGEWDRCG